MASGIYYNFFADLMNKELDLEADTIKVMLLDDSHSFTNSNTVIGDVSANEISGTGYTAGGATLASKAVTAAATTKWDADNTAWTSATFSAYHAVIWDDTHASDHIICSIDFGGVQTVTSGTFTIQWDAAGIITMVEV